MSDPVNQQAVSIILEGRGTQFDPDVADAFREITGTFRGIALQFSDEVAQSDTSRQASGTAGFPDT